MGTSSRRWATLVVALVAATAACSGTDAGAPTATTAPAAPRASADWPTFGFDRANSRANPTARPTRDDVGTLAPTWHVQDLTGVSSTPAVVDGVVYVGDWKGTVHAFDAATGAERWATPLGQQVQSSVTIDGDAAYVANNRGLARLDRATGAVRWQATTTDHPIAITPASPVVVDGLVLLGVASGELMIPRETYTFRGFVAAFDAATGAERWRTSVAPEGRSGAGVGVWSTVSVDPDLGLAFVGTGNTYEPPAGPLSDSIVALRYRTGEIAWSTQFTYPDVWSTGHTGGVDGDVGAGPNLWRIGDRPVVGAGDKRGVYHALDRATGERVWETPMTPGSVLGGVIGTAAHLDGQVLVASNVGRDDTNTPTGKAQVLALDDATGAIRWRHELDGAVYAPVTATPGLVFVGTTAGKMVVLDAATGDERWSADAPDQVGGGAAVVGGTVYWGYGYALFGTGSGKGGLYAFSPAGATGSSGTSGSSGGTAGSAVESPGARLYRTSCASCHGDRGQGGVGPELTGVASRLTRDQHVTTVRDGRPGTQMPAFGATLTDAEIDAVVDHERSALARPGGGATTATSAPTATTAPTTTAAPPAGG